MDSNKNIRITVKHYNKNDHRNHQWGREWNFRFDVYLFTKREIVARAKDTRVTKGLNHHWFWSVFLNLECLKKLLTELQSCNFSRLESRIMGVYIKIALKNNMNDFIIARNNVEFKTPKLMKIMYPKILNCKTDF